MGNELSTPATPLTEIDSLNETIHDQNATNSSSPAPVNLSLYGRDPNKAQVDAIARGLDHSFQQRALANSNLKYVSRDLGLGVRQTLPMPPDGVINAPAEHFDHQTQRDAFQLIKHDVQIELKTRGTHPWIRFPKVERSFYHYQVFAAFWLLKHERGWRRGAIEADLMGLGKTTIAFLYIFLNFLIAENFRHVQQFPERHYQQDSDEAIDLDDEPCPSAHLFAIECSCLKRSITRSLSPRLGASLVFVPKSLIGTWESEWRQFGVDPSLGMHFHIQHGDFPHQAIPPEHLHSIQLPKDNSKDVGISDAGPLVAHRYVVVTTAESYYTRLAEYAGNRMRVWQQPVQNAPKRAHLTDDLAWGRVVVDEAHLRVNASTQVYTILTSLAQNRWGPPNFVALTGTPMLRNGVGDMIALVSFIVAISPELQRPAERRSDFADPGYLLQLRKRFTECSRRFYTNSSGTFTVTDHMLARDIGECLRMYCIRRRSSSMQNGKILAYIPPLERYDIECHDQPGVSNVNVEKLNVMLKKTLTDEWVTQLDGWMNRGSGSLDFECTTGTLLENILLARVIATVPGLANYGPRKHLSWQHIQRHRWHEYPRNSPFYASMESLKASSGKLQALGELLRRWDDCTTWDGQPEQLVIVSEFALICHIVTCFCLHAGFEVKWIHAETAARDRLAIVREFQEGASRKKPSSFRILIGTSRIIGQGLTLNRAHRLVLMEPSHHAGVEDQNADRVHRLGSMTDRCWFYRLINPESIIEQLSVAHQNGQRGFQHMVEWLL